MARSRILANLNPTVLAAPNGVPIAQGIRFVLPAAKGHGHGHSGLRSDVPPKWSSNVRLARYGLLSQSHTTALASRQVHTSAPSRRDINVPDFGPYRTSNEESNRALSYFFIGSMGVLSATAAKSTVTDFLATMAASADVLALAKVEVEMNSIPEGKNVIIKWRGKPVFIRHRTQDEISEANSVDVKSLRDPEADSARVKKPEWLVMLGSARVMAPTTTSRVASARAPLQYAPSLYPPRPANIPQLNLEVPAHDFNEAEGKIVIG
ncbi:Ubiquinol-cytochrome C reductase iron-sulfur subunit [Ceratobasidium theobromae]|uniref:Ubiquinol-cytochrome C reductase iron-sulfur subunit n=1 Tax=Ceratobasidium theobromae TaxID=1582974 RepID=A0A5N5QIE4_9AGAM|nr:Ubiquinol-cytochrome C reductase iron-sulfur subunit [Ceratobasidium theobromae]